VVVPRESPFNGIHLKNLSILHQEGAVILPAMMTFYHNPVHVQDMVDQFVGKILQQFDIHYSKFKSWQGE
jgi:4-hydroxy-3-polyprenylbenzoate decarboxylase